MSLITYTSRYLDSDNTMKKQERDAKGQVIQENINVGILAALVSTICFSMLQQADSSSFFSEPSDLQDAAGFAYVVFWVCSSGATLAATVMSVLIILAVNETASREEAEFVLEIIDATTFGFGTHSPLFLLYIGFILGAGGILAYLFLFFTVTVALVSMCTAALIITVFLLTYLSIVAGLHVGRQYSKFIRHDEEEVDLTVDHLKQLLPDCNVFLLRFLRSAVTNQVFVWPSYGSASRDNG